MSTIGVESTYTSGGAGHDRVRGNEAGEAGTETSAGTGGGTGEAILPVLRTLAKELQKYPDVEFVDVTDPEQHVHIATVNGSCEIDDFG